MRRGIRAGLLAGVFLIANTGVALAAAASPSAGGAQPAGHFWNMALLKVLIVGVPVVLIVGMWLVLARKPRA